MEQGTLCEARIKLSSAGCKIGALPTMISFWPHGNSSLCQNPLAETDAKLMKNCRIRQDKIKLTITWQSSSGRILEEWEGLTMRWGLLGGGGRESNTSPIPPSATFSCRERSLSIPWKFLGPTLCPLILAPYPSLGPCQSSPELTAPDGQSCLSKAPLPLHLLSMQAYNTLELWGVEIRSGWSNQKGRFCRRS